MDFWEAILMASSQEAVIQELLFRLTSVYIDRLTNTNPQTHSSLAHTPSRRRPLKTADDLVQSLKFYFKFRCFLYLLLVFLSLSRIKKTSFLWVFQINSCSHYGPLYPWLTVLSPGYTTSYQHQEALHKLQVLGS